VTVCWSATFNLANDPHSLYRGAGYKRFLSDELPHKCRLFHARATGALGVVCNEKVGDLWPSDHFGVFARVRVKLWHQCLGRYIASQDLTTDEFVEELETSARSLSK